MERAEFEGEATRLSDALGTTDVALNHYRVPPGEGLPSGLHAHADQEEVFLVLEGEATFETLDGDVTVAAGEAVRFPRGEFQSGENRGDDPLVVLAVGAPRDSTDVRLPLPCPDCGRDDVRLDTDEELTFVCPDCGLERVPDPCPDCGSDALSVTTDDEDRPVVACGDCGSRFADAPTTTVSGSES